MTEQWHGVLDGGRRECHGVSRRCHGVWRSQGFHNDGMSRSVTEKGAELSTMWGSVECVEVRGWEWRESPDRGLLTEPRVSLGTELTELGKLGTEQCRVDVPPQPNWLSWARFCRLGITGNWVVTESVNSVPQSTEQFIHLVNLVYRVQFNYLVSIVL